MPNQGKEKDIQKRQCACCIRNLPRWSEVPYPGQNTLPVPEEPQAPTWPTVFIYRDKLGDFRNKNGDIIEFDILNPLKGIDFRGEQLAVVRSTLANLTEQQVAIATYWGTGPATKQWTPIIDRLIDTYRFSPPRAARVLAAVNSAFNDAFVVTWYFKFLWKIPRPVQLDPSLETVLPTPLHPSYPSGHSVIAGCAETILGYFFRPEKQKLERLADECAISRVYAGVHYPIDAEEGLMLGRHIGDIVVDTLRRQVDGNNDRIDIQITEFRDAKLPPPPYEQVIPYPYDINVEEATNSKKI